MELLFINQIGIITMDYDFKTDWKVFVELKDKDNEKEDNKNGSSRV